LTGEVRAFLKSTDGQQALREFFTAVRETVDALMPGVRALGRALMDAIVALAPVLPQVGEAFSAIAEEAAPVIRDFAELAAQILPPLLSLLKQMAPILGPLAVAWIGVTGAVKGFNLVTKQLAPIAQIMKWANGISLEFGKVGKAADANGKKLTGFQGKISKLFSGGGLLGTALKIGGVAGIALDLASLIPIADLDKYEQRFGSFWGNILGGGQNALRGLGDMWDGLWSGILTGDWSTFQQGWDLFVSGISAGGSAIWDGLQTVGSAFATWIGGLPAQVGQCASETWTAFTTWLAQ